jgi:hypothetical protein
MALDASYQAIPYEPLLARAMADREAGEALRSFVSLATVDLANSPFHDDPTWLELAPIARRVRHERPGLLDRTFSTRAWDAIYWLLAPNRRAGGERDPAGLAEIAVFGAEPFASAAAATQGVPLLFVRPSVAAEVAEYVAGFDAEQVTAEDVYKAPWSREELAEVLANYTRLYRGAAELDECVLVVRD